MQNRFRNTPQPRRQISAGRCGRFVVSAAAFVIVAWTAFRSTCAMPPAEEDRMVTPDPVSVIRYGPAWRYPRAGWIVVHIEGTPYERGYQHGQLLAAEIVDYIRAIADQRSAKAPKEAWRDLRILCDSLFLRQYDGEYLEEMKGIADGAAAAGGKFDGRRLDLLDIVTLNADIEVGFLEAGLEASATGIDTKRFSAPQYSQPKVRLKEHCSAFVANGPATADGKIVLGHITMSDLGYVSHFNVWLDLVPSNGHRIVFQTFPGGIQSGLDYYISDSGLIVSETTIAQTRYHREGKALASRIRRAVQYADSIDQVVEILSDGSNGLYTNQWLLGDIRTNEIAMFELGTSRTKLWRSSRQEWPDGTAGFYWGCNNIRDIEVFKETVPDLRGKPANLVRHPRTRDKAWLEVFEKHKGRIDEVFAFEALTTPPLAAFPSCDAKFTTADLAKELKSWVLFGPPLGKTWDPSPADRKKYPGIVPLVPNDWALLGIEIPPNGTDGSKPVDLAAFPKEERDDKDEVKFDARHPFAWRGTLLPASDADIWLAAGFAEYEHVVAFEKACRLEGDRGKLSRGAQDLVDRALFAHESRWLTAARRLGRDGPPARTHADPARREWYDIAVGKGVLLLATLRSRLGAEACDELFDQFGTAHAGQKVTTAEFIEHCERRAGKPTADLVRAWHADETPTPQADRNIWTIESFEAEPERGMIVYGTLRDRAAQREAAMLLQRAVARRFSNVALPLRADTEVTEEELRDHHLLLIGRPGSNRVAERLVRRLPVRFTQNSFQIRQETFAHPDSSIIAAGDNPLNPRFSVVAFAGLSAEATWKCVQSLPEEDDEPPSQVLLAPAGRKPQRFCLVRSSESLAKP